MQPKRYRQLALFWIAVTGSAELTAQELSPQHQRLAFLEGSWTTRSEFPDGTVAYGDLEYEWVLGGTWMRVEFVGRHPTRSPWEAHVMMRWVPERGEYVSHVFASPDTPSVFRGRFLDNGVFRVEVPTDDGVAGIDYHPRDGSVYQENWIEESGSRRVTLRTTYARH
ncbi:MAG: DUF1579 family protein [Gemmatimonadales bacterium]